MRLIFTLFFAVVTAVGCSSVSVRDITESSKEPVVVFIETLTYVPHSKYEHNLLRKELAGLLGNDHDILTCINDMEDTDKVADTVYSCDDLSMEEYPEHSVDVRIMIDRLRGVSNTGNVYGRLLEGTGSVSVTLDIDNGLGIKKYSLNGTGKTERFAGLDLAKGLDTAIIKITERIREIIRDNILR